MRKIIFSLLILLVIVGVLIMLFSITRKLNVNTKQNFEYLTVLSLDSIEHKIDFKSADTTLVFVFNSECDICVIELEELLIDYHLFESFRIFVLSRQSIKELFELGTYYDIWNYSNLNIIKIDEGKTEEPFVSSPNPSVFVFDTNGKLIHSKKGYSKPEVLIQQIRKKDDNR
ncbi:MAG: hypothetical protein PHD06_13150 [Bacteroidales bacterium]|jgi:hypothetical protein|nr:hypothetical protein [Bacteroidales bacterium]MDY0142857.1 hypothetical protein [Bacteroidales bacterium]